MLLVSFQYKYLQEIILFDMCLFLFRIAYSVFGSFTLLLFDNLDKVPSKAKGSVRVIGLFAEETEIFEQYHNSIQSSPSSMSDSESKKGRPFG